MIKPKLMYLVTVNLQIFREINVFILKFKKYFINFINRTFINSYAYRSSDFSHSCIWSDPRLFGTKSLTKSFTESLGENLDKTFGETCRAKDCHQESCRESPIGSYAWFSARLSPRLVFLRGHEGYWDFFNAGN